MIYIETKQQQAIKTLIIEAIEEVTGVPRELWEQARSKNRDEVFIRKMYVWMLKKYGRYTNDGIARCVSLKNISTVVKCHTDVDAWFDSEEHTMEASIMKQIEETYEQLLSKNPITYSGHR